MSVYHTVLDALIDAKENQGREFSVWPCAEDAIKHFACSASIARCSKNEMQATISSLQRIIDANGSDNVITSEFYKTII